MGLRRGTIATLIVVAGIIPFAGSVAATPVTKAQFIMQANALWCRADGIPADVSTVLQPNKQWLTHLTANHSVGRGPCTHRPESDQ